MRSIYLDYCTTTPVAASVRECMLPFLGELYGHPLSNHWFGRAAQEAVEDARSHVAAMLGCHPCEVYFTSGGTESINLALIGVARAVTKNLPNLTPHLITTELDHTCVLKCAHYLESQGWQSTTIGCDKNGVVKLDEFEDAIRDNTRIASVIHANHRIGTIQPIAQLSAICKQRDVLLHTDAGQSVGKLDCNVDSLGVDLLSLSGHKFYAPKGIGALYIRLGVPVEPLFFGEGCEGGIRPGTTNVPHIVGLGQAAKLALAGLPSSQSQAAMFRDRFHHLLENILKRPIPVHGEHAERLPNVLSMELPGVSGEAIQQMLPEICLGPSTCQAGIGNGRGTTWNKTHAAIGLTEQQSANTLRVSFGWTSSDEEMQQAVQMLAAAYESLVD